MCMKCGDSSCLCFRLMLVLGSFLLGVGVVLVRVVSSCVVRFLVEWVIVSVLVSVVFSLMVLG